MKKILSKNENYIVPFCIGINLIMLSGYIFYTAIIQPLIFVAAISFAEALFVLFAGIFFCYTCFFGNIIDRNKEEGGV